MWIPFTFVFLAMMVVANYAAGTLTGSLPMEALRNWGVSHSSIAKGQMFRLLSGTFLSHDLAMFLRQFAFAALVIGYYEWTQGTWRAVAMFFVLDSLATLVALFCVLRLIAPPRVSQEHDVGMSAGGFGLIGAILVLWPGRYWLLLIVMAAIVVKYRWRPEPIADGVHLVALLCGFALQYLVIWKSVVGGSVG
jgi:hypothetical protein